MGKRYALDDTRGGNVGPDHNTDDVATEWASNQAGWFHLRGEKKRPNAVVRGNRLDVGIGRDCV
jgi:hypothetical protein